eukprot:TRINITY_DN3586_c0_g1_i3.p1 TRINITY_DN3586_c0_g1~~TRINITY_DN3586_c0_g1_i3.p1  ORF type:complete len:724 (-),score=171.42 TRINITY_DN3586_c0_g1_i3:1554-3725(-)
MATLAVTVEEGSALSGEGCSAFCEVLFLAKDGSKRFKRTTRSVKCAPGAVASWKETFTWVERNASDCVGGIQVVCWDHHLFVSNKNLGAVTIKLNHETLEENHIDDWFTLTPRAAANKGGKVHLHMSYSGLSSTAPAATPVAVVAAKSPITDTVTPEKTAAAAQPAPPKPSEADTPQDKPAAADSQAPAIATPASAPAPESDKQEGKRELTKSNEGKNNFLHSSANWGVRDNELKTSAFVVIPEEVAKRMAICNAGSTDNAEFDDEDEVGELDEDYADMCAGDDENESSAASTAVSPMAKLRADVQEVIGINKVAKGPLITSIEWQEQNLMVSLTSPKTSVCYTMLIPEEYPRGEFYAFGDDGCKDLGAGSLKVVFTRLVLLFASEQGVDPTPIFDVAALKKPRPLEQSADLGAELKWQDFEEEAENKEALREAISFVERSSASLGKDIKISFCVLDTTLFVRVIFHPSMFLDQQTAACWGINFDKPLVVELTLTAPYYFTSTIVPQINEFQSLEADSGVLKLADASSFGLQWFVHNRLERLMKSAGVWPPKSFTFFSDLVAMTTNKILACTQNCVICDKKLPFEMTKPAVCDNPLCIFSHMQFGLGEDVAAEIQHHPMETDLLIMLTCAATNSPDTRRFNPFPSCLEVKTTDDAGVVTTHNFMECDTPNLVKVRQVIECIPPISELAKYKETASLQKFLNRCQHTHTHVHTRNAASIRWRTC